jgi:Cu2+-exporting ATPase
MIQLSHGHIAKCEENLWWATAYKMIVVPLSVGELAPIGFVIPTSVGAILMSVAAGALVFDVGVMWGLDLQPEAGIEAIL